MTARKQGYEAGIRNDHIRSMPFAKRSIDWREWLDGWLEGKAILKHDFWHQF